jgi:hypothetical protein
MYVHIPEQKGYNKAKEELPNQNMELSWAT